MLRIHLMISLSCILNTHQQIHHHCHTNYTDPYFDFIYVANLLVHVMKESDSFMSEVYIAWIV